MCIVSACACPALAQSSPERVVDRLAVRIDLIVDRFETRLEREADVAVARLSRLRRTGASDAVVDSALSESESRLAALAAGIRNTVQGMALGGLGSLDRLEKTPSIVVPSVDFRSLRGKLQRGAGLQLARVDELLADAFADLESAAAEDAPPAPPSEPPAG